MKVLLLGATGSLGSAVLSVLIHSGSHQVTALVRNPDRIPAASGLTIVKGDITDISVIRRVVDGKDVVISCIGPRGHGARTIYSDALRSVVRACDDAKVGRIILVTRDVDGGRDASNAPPLGQKLGAMFRGAVNRDMRELEEFLGNVADVDFGRRALHPNSGDAKLRTSTVTVVRPYAFSGADTVEYRAEVTGDGTTCIKGCSYHTSKRAAAQFIVDKAVKKEYANAAVLLDTPGVTGCF